MSVYSIKYLIYRLTMNWVIENEIYSDYNAIFTHFFIVISKFLLEVTDWYNVGGQTTSSANLDSIKTEILCIAKDKFIVWDD